MVDEAVHDVAGDVGGIGEKGTRCKERIDDLSELMSVGEQ